MAIIAITGKKRSGKDTSAQFLADTYGFITVSLADPLKKWLHKVDPLLPFPSNAKLVVFYLLLLVKNFRIPRYSDLLKYFSEDVLKDGFPVLRKMLQYTGSDLVRECDPDFWVNNLVKKINSIENSDGPNNYVISDVRFDNEIHTLKSTFNDVIVVEIIRDTGFYDQHYSEAGISRDLVDYTIYNDYDINNLFYSLSEIVNNTNLK